MRIHTFAEGFLARLAHDLEVGCDGLSGTATRTEDGRGPAVASVDVPLGGLSVVGVVTGGSVDEHVLSSSERAEIVAKMQRDVFHSGADGIVRVEASYEEGTVRMRVLLPNGNVVEMMTRPHVAAEGAATRATGTFGISLAAMGSSKIKGPMGAFRLKDNVEVSFNLVFTPA